MWPILIGAAVILGLGALLSSDTKSSAPRMPMRKGTFELVSRFIPPHTGLDLGAPVGTPVYAIADGTVEYVTVEGDGKNELGGTACAIQHTGGLRTYNAHLDEVFVSAGQRVSQGERIGTVGNTGNARTTGPHLHFELKKNGTFVDPLKVLVA